MDYSYATDTWFTGQVKAGYDQYSMYWSVEANPYTANTTFMGTTSSAAYWSIQYTLALVDPSGTMDPQKNVYSTSIQDD